MCHFLILSKIPMNYSITFPPKHYDEMVSLFHGYVAKCETQFNLSKKPRLKKRFKKRLK